MNRYARESESGVKPPHSKGDEHVADFSVKEGEAIERPKYSKVPIFLILLLAAAMRLTLFDLMEFKYDEVTVLVEARSWLERGIPQYGMMSGVGVRNPPGFMFLLTPLTAVVSSPLAIGIIIALSNVAAVWLIIRIGTELGSRSGGLWAGLFMAVHPWLTLYSRKIWAQSLLPLCVSLFLFVVVRCLNRRRSRAIFWLGPLLCITWQIHYSAYCLLAFALLWLAHEALRKRLNCFMLLAGILAGAFTLLPYLTYLVGNGAAQVNPMRVSLATGRLDNGWEVCRAWARTGFAGGFGYPFAFGFEPLSKVWSGGGGLAIEACALAGTLLIFMLALFALVAGVPRRNDGAAPPPVLWLGTFAVLPPMIYAVRGIPSPPHYFIVGLPALLLLAGDGMRRLDQAPFFGRCWRRVPGIVAAVCGVAIWSAVLLRINIAGGAAGDYGPAYRAQRSVALVLAEAGIAGRDVDAKFCRDHAIGVHYLLKYVLPVRQGEVDIRAELIDTLIYPRRSCAGRAALEQAQIGPFRICFYGH